ncbi:MAG: NAD(P)-dependent oxidoreductase [Bacteroidales bacterium]
MKKKLYILDKVHPVFYEKLGNKFEIEDDFTRNHKDIAKKITDAYGLIIRSRLTFDRELIDAAPKLRFIARVGAGMESIDVDYAESKGIFCLNSPEGNRDAVAEHAIGMLLSLKNHLCRADKQVKQGDWQRELNRGTELKGKTVGIVGFGNMGSAFAERLQGFSCRVLAYDKYKTRYAPAGISESSMENIFREADVVSLHIPLDEENKHLCNEAWFDAFDKPVLLLNTARGPVVKTDALLAAMEAGKVVAAGLDVLEYEESSFENTKKLTGKETFNKLAARDDVIFTPHVAGWTAESKEKLAYHLIEKILRVG